MKNKVFSVGPTIDSNDMTPAEQKAIFGFVVGYSDPNASKNTMIVTKVDRKRA